MTVQETLRREVLQVLSGQRTGVPGWVQELSQGEDAGFFAEGGAVWTVHQDIATLVAGPRALLVQALHPGAMAGVHDHSRYREDPLGRLNGTIRWITTVSYGSTGQARAASDRVGRLHRRVNGNYRAESADVSYSAGDPELLSWVHLAFTDSFLRSHQRFSHTPIPGGADAYVREWAIAGELMGVPEPPRSVRELERRLDDVWASGVLRVDDRVRDAVRFIRDPPLPALVRPTYPLIFRGSVASLAKRERRMLGLAPVGVASAVATRAVLRSTKNLLGEAAAVGQMRARLARLTADEVPLAADSERTTP